MAGPRISSSIIVVVALLCLVCMLQVSAEETRTRRKEEAVRRWHPHVCRDIFEYFPNCMGFLVGSNQYSMPSTECCHYVEKLNKMAKRNKFGPRIICSCIELMVKGVKPSLIPSRIQALPNMCQTTLSFPISDSMNCSMV